MSRRENVLIRDESCATMMLTLILISNTKTGQKWPRMLQGTLAAYYALGSPRTAYIHIRLSVCLTTMLPFELANIDL